MIMSNEEKRKLVEQWLDYRIEVNKQDIKHIALPIKLSGEKVQVCYPREYIHIYNIGPIIDFMGYDAKWIEREGEVEYKYEVQFTYKGVLFLGLYDEEGYKKWHK